MELKELGDIRCSVQILSVTQVVAWMGVLPLTAIRVLVQTNACVGNMVQLNLLKKELRGWLVLVHSNGST